MINNCGPSLEPCGTPTLKCQTSHHQPLQLAVYHPNNSWWFNGNLLQYQPGSIWLTTHCATLFQTPLGRLCFVCLVLFYTMYNKSEETWEKAQTHKYLLRRISGNRSPKTEFPVRGSRSRHLQHSWWRKGAGRCFIKRFERHFGFIHEMRRRLELQTCYLG